MQSLTPEQLARLPQYAQHYIGQLEKRLLESRKTVAQLRQGPEDSNVRIRHHGEPDHLLGKSVPVTFNVLQPHIGKDIPPTPATFTVHHQGPFTLEIRSSSGAVEIVPVVSNTIKLRVRDWS